MSEQQPRQPGEPSTNKPAPQQQPASDVPNPAPVNKPAKSKE